MARVSLQSDLRPINLKMYGESFADSIILPTYHEKNNHQEYSTFAYCPTVLSV